MTFIPSFTERTWKTFSITPAIFMKTLYLLCRKKVMEEERFFKLYLNKTMEKSLYR